MQVADVAEKDVQEDKQPDPVELGTGPSRGVTVTVACLAALLVIGAAAATLLPTLAGVSLPSFDRITLPKFDHLAIPGFHRTPAPKSSRVATTPPPETAKPPSETISVPIPDPFVRAALTDIQSSQRQSTIVLASLTQSSATQQEDLKKISRQLSALAGQVEALTPPLTTSSIPRTTPSILATPRPHARARILRASRRP